MWKYCLVVLAVVLCAGFRYPCTGHLDPGSYTQSPLHPGAPPERALQACVQYARSYINDPKGQWERFDALVGRCMHEEGYRRQAEK